MNKDIIFIFEFISGGGFSFTKMPNSLFCEGFGMLKTIISDFKLLNFEIITLLDYRVSFLSKFLQADIIREVKADENYLVNFKKAVRESKYSFIIAPESSNILYELTKIVKDYDKELLSTNLSCIIQFTSKIKTFDYFKKNDIPTPTTYRIPKIRSYLNVDFIIQKSNKIGYPIVIKPEDGVGSESIYFFEGEDQILDFFEKSNKGLEQNRSYVLQEFIEGRDLSLSLLGCSQSKKTQITNPIILSINSQHINIRNQNAKSEYYGGSTPVDGIEELIENFEKSVKKADFSKFKGYFGIDFIKQSNSSFYFIELNPRLTTSYLGLRNVINYNCAELIYKSKINSLKNLDLKILNYSLFSRIDLLLNNYYPTKHLNKHLLPKLMKEIPELVTPPISIDKSNQYSCLVATKTKDYHSSKRRMDEIYQYFKRLGFDIVR